MLWNQALKDQAKGEIFLQANNRAIPVYISLTSLKPKLEKLKSRFGSSTENLAAMALNYILAQPRVACVIPGFRNERQARCNVAGVNKPMRITSSARCRAN